MTYQPDNYHQTNPPCELKSAVMGRMNSKKSKSSVSPKPKNDKQTCLRCTGDKQTMRPNNKMPQAKDKKNALTIISVVAD